jgi:hypothetical protein
LRVVVDLAGALVVGAGDALGLAVEVLAGRIARDVQVVAILERDGQMDAIRLHGVRAGSCRGAIGRGE